MNAAQATYAITTAVKAALDSASVDQANVQWDNGPVAAKPATASWYLVTTKISSPMPTVAIGGVGNRRHRATGVCMIRIYSRSGIGDGAALATASAIGTSIYAYAAPAGLRINKPSIRSLGEDAASGGGTGRYIVAVDTPFTFDEVS